MEPAVQYATTSDGIRIAFTVSGQGSPLVFVTEPVVSHVQLEWSQPLFGRLFRRLAERHTLVRFDARGTGLSDRGIKITDRTAFRRDMETVIARVGLKSFALAVVQGPTLNTIEYVRDHPESVERLVVIDGFLKGEEYIAGPQLTALRAAADADFVLATEAIGTVAFGPTRDETRDYGAYIRSCIDASFFDAAPQFSGWDVSDAAAHITAPTLVLKHAGIQYVTDAMARGVAATIPGARLAMHPGTWADNIEGLADRIIEFLGEGKSETGTQPLRAERAQTASPVTILFTDVERNTELLALLGDEAWRALLREHERMTREQLKAYSGAEIKTIGDAFMTSFASATQAVECAIAVQRAFAERNTAAKHPLHVRIGINCGEPIAEDGDLFGTSVTMASRIAGTAAGGEIVVANVVRELVAGKGFLFADRGDVVLRGFEDPVRLYEVRWLQAG
jgi:class 3 adenylate cyclase